MTTKTIYFLALACVALAGCSGDAGGVLDGGPLVDVGYVVGDGDATYDLLLVGNDLLSEDPPDLSAVVEMDMSVLPDLSVPPDLAAPRDLAPLPVSCHYSFTWNGVVYTGTCTLVTSTGFGFTVTFGWGGFPTSGTVRLDVGLGDAFANGFRNLGAPIATFTLNTGLGSCTTWAGLVAWTALNAPGWSIDESANAATVHPCSSAAAFNNLKITQ